jgi:hypothetical protein
MAVNVSTCDPLCNRHPHTDFATLDITTLWIHIDVSQALSTNIQTVGTSINTASYGRRLDHTHFLSFPKSALACSSDFEVRLTSAYCRLIFVCLTNILLITSLVSLVSNSLTEVSSPTIEVGHRRRPLPNLAADLTSFANADWFV